MQIYHFIYTGKHPELNNIYDYYVPLGAFYGGVNGRMMSIYNMALYINKGLAGYIPSFRTMVSF